MLMISFALAVFIISKAGGEFKGAGALFVLLAFFDIGLFAMIIYAIFYQP